jgi:MFS family permease
MDNSVRKAYMAIMLFGVVSLLGDTVYEGSRGVIAPYLQSLGASAFAVGLVGGLGEFLGYVLRLASGYVADSTRAYWLLTFIGYGLIVAVPFLALSPTWQWALVLVLLERIGKAIRSPARDALLAQASQGIGSGKSFGIHEALDQTGAILGPVLASYLMFTTHNHYRSIFAFSTLPYVLLLIALYIAYRILQNPMPEKTSAQENRAPLDRRFYLYVLAVFFNTLGLVHALLLTYKASTLVPDAEKWLVPGIYTVIMAVDALIAIPAGLGYDRQGLRFLLLPFALSFLPSILVVWAGHFAMIAVAAILVGVILGAQESVYRAAVADLAPLASRGWAYGIFNTFYGLGMLASGAIFGYFIDHESVFLALPYTMVMQAIAIFLLWQSSRQKA